MSEQRTRYACTCGATKVVPEPPLSPTPKIRTGCERCEALMPHYPVGHPAGTAFAQAQTTKR